MFSASMSSRIALDTCYRAAGTFRLPPKKMFRCPNLTDTVEIDASANPNKKKIDFYSLKLCK